MRPGGPTSQHDTIELRGFDDAGETVSRNKAKQIAKPSSKPNSRDSRSNAGSRKSSSEEISIPKTANRKLDKDIEPELPTASSSPKVETAEGQKSETENAAPTDEPERTENHDFFNLEDLLQFDNLPLLTNGGGGEGNQSSSRFTQWFRRDSPSEINDTRRSSVQDDMIKNIVNDINETSINIPNMKDSDAYFAPISPPGTTSGNSLLEMLQNGGHHQKNDRRGNAPSIKDLEATGKVTSVEELEAKMRQGVGQSPNKQTSEAHSKKTNSSGRKEEELIAFKKLLKQVAEGGVTTANDHINRANNASSLLFQMLNKPPEASDMMGQAHQPAAAPAMHVPHDLVYKLLHVQEQQRQVQQQQEFNKLLFSSGRLAPPQVPGTLSPLPPELQMKVNNAQPSVELLSRPEAQAILQGLRQGEITPQHLIQQLQNPAMQPRHREVLASILKLHGNSPRPASPLMVPPDPSLIQQLMLQQQLRNPSPLPPIHNVVYDFTEPYRNRPNHAQALISNVIALVLPGLLYRRLRLKTTLFYLGVKIDLGRRVAKLVPNLKAVFRLPMSLRIITGLPHRVPSPRELMLHTQTIMQSALIKKKRENFRKRQELQRATSPNVTAGAKSPNPPVTSTNTNNPSSNLSSSASLSNVANNNSNSVNSNNNNNNNKTVSTGGGGGGVNTHMNNNNSNSGTNSSSSSSMGGSTPAAATSKSNPTSATKSPTPLAFTPTSVLRKMTAEQQQPVQVKDGDGNKLNKYNELYQAKLQRQSELFKAQSSRFLANNQLMGLRSPHQQWLGQKQPVQQPLQPQPQQQQGRAIVKGSSSYVPAPPLGAGLVDLPYGTNNTRGVFPQRSKWTIPTAPLVAHVQPNLYNSFPTPANRVPQNRGLAPQMGPATQHNVNMNPALQHLLMSSESVTSAQQRTMFKPGIRNSFPQFLPPNGGDGDLSTSPTTSNQLAHWFTPELLAQAQVQTRTGKSDSTLNMVSVEELERLQQNSAPIFRGYLMKTDENCEITRHGEKTAWKTQEIPESIEQWEEKREKKPLGRHLEPPGPPHGVVGRDLGLGLGLGRLPRKRSNFILSNGVHTTLTSEYAD
ncbi:hypothetical protein RUM43_011553 [Polyplax serrata]|uniref:Uncharacterized protein n=1 Tax=Polyplax serrata TaxID=468196 RepID=A0AAN8PFA9_POLSC